MRSSILSAIIKVDGKTFEGQNHAEAIKKAINAKVNVSKVNRWNDGYFKTSDNRIIDRGQAKKEFGINTAEEIPTQFGGKKLKTVPDPRK